MVERHGRQIVSLFWDGEIIAEGTRVRVTGDAAHHARVRRVQVGDAVRLLDGQGGVANGEVLTFAKEEMAVAVEGVVYVPRPTPLEVIVPVADRDRMLLAAEKCVELQVTAWRPVYFARSRSVSPRGEGPKFRDKVLARMQSALEQSGGAWLPSMSDETEGSHALREAERQWSRLLLDANGEPISGLAASVPTVIAVGPEGGLEREEVAIAEECGWVLASLGATTLRFETAVIAAAAVIRATQLKRRSS